MIGRLEYACASTGRKSHRESFAHILKRDIELSFRAPIFSRAGKMNVHIVLHKARNPMKINVVLETGKRDDADKEIGLYYTEVCRINPVDFLEGEATYLSNGPRESLEPLSEIPQPLKCSQILISGGSR